ncbi:DsbA family protein [Erythrobacter sp.]|uniref:DsbA family protein n=1 Tax=Erythrobacter sp. TaxID=1042 RepID=UPI0025CF40B5|nr:DsbA family protein [Erythrobacter sp.]
MTRRQLLSLIVLVILGASVAQILKNNRQLGRNLAGSSTVTEILTRPGSPETVRGKGDVTVVMFTDYQCAACRMASPHLRRAIEHDGNVRVIYKEWPIFGDRSKRAAAVALASDRQGIYRLVHHHLMQSPSFNEAALRDAVEAAGGSWQQVEDDLRTHGSAISEQISVNRMDALNLGLQGTPAFLIGSSLVQGALTDREFLKAFDQARSRP